LKYDEAHYALPGLGILMGVLARIWCRRAKFSSSRAARERKIEGRVARSVARKLSIGKENYEKDKPHPLTQIKVFERHRQLPANNEERSCLGSAENGEAEFPVSVFPPLRGGDFQGITGLSSDDSSAVRSKQRGSSRLQ
jgi:hypothetical protein